MAAQSSQDRLTTSPMLYPLPSPGSDSPASEASLPLIELTTSVVTASNPGSQANPQAPPQISQHILWRLYVSHFLSTWNSRSFEFGAVLFLASIFSGTLLHLSVYALLRSASAILFSSAIGHAVDTGNRLAMVRFSIGKRVYREPGTGLCID